MAKVSVCVPTYNTARYIGETIESILAQTFGDFELVVCDNASTDGTDAVCAKVTDPRFRYERFEEFVGQAANWNRALGLARSEYVILLHSDDTILPRFLERTVAALESNPDAVLAHCAVELIDGEGKVTGLKKIDLEDRVDSGDRLARRLLLEGCVVCPAGVLVRRSAFEAAGAFTDRIVWGVDWHMWTRLALRGRVVYLAKPLARYRTHSTNGTAGVMATARNGTDEVWMMRDLFGLIPADRADLHALRPKAFRQVAHRTWCFAEEMCRLGFSRPTRVGIKRAVRIDPRLLLKGRVWALWAASFLGYKWFRRLHRLIDGQAAGS